MARNKDGVDISTIVRLHRRYNHRPMRAGAWIPLVSERTDGRPNHSARQ